MAPDDQRSTPDSDSTARTDALTAIPSTRDEQFAADSDDTTTKIVSPFKQGNSVVLAVTRYFDEDQALQLDERRRDDRTCIIVEEVHDP